MDIHTSPCKIQSTDNSWRFCLFYTSMKTEPYGLGVKKIARSRRIEQQPFWVQRQIFHAVDAEKRDLYKSERLFSFNKTPHTNQGGKFTTNRPEKWWLNQQPVWYFVGRPHRAQRNIGSVSSPVLYDFAQQRVLFLLVSRVNSCEIVTRNPSKNHNFIWFKFDETSFSHSANGEPFNLWGCHVW